MSEIGFKILSGSQGLTAFADQHALVKLDIQRTIFNGFWVQMIYGCGRFASSLNAHSKPRLGLAKNTLRYATTSIANIGGGTWEMTSSTLGPAFKSIFLPQQINKKFIHQQIEKLGFTVKKQMRFSFPERTVFDCSKNPRTPTLTRKGTFCSTVEMQSFIFCKQR